MPVVVKWSGVSGEGDPRPEMPRAAGDSSARPAD